MTVFHRLRILPLLVIVASLSLTFRIGELAVTAQQAGTAQAQEAADDAEPPPLPVPGDMNTEGAGDTDDMMASDGETGQAPGTPEAPAMEEGEDIEWQDSGEAAFTYSEVREDLYKDLRKRRQEIEQRARALATQAALLEAAERELDQKLRELSAVRDEIKGLLEQQSEAENARINSLVKIYEGMKAKDAARIFNTLDLDVLIDVMSRMSERKSAPILAEMNPERARSVTIMLAQQKKLPELPPQ